MLKTKNKKKSNPKTSKPVKVVETKEKVIMRLVLYAVILYFAISWVHDYRILWLVLGIALAELIRHEELK